MTTQFVCASVAAFAVAISLHAAEVIQMDVHSVLTGRAVTTLTDGNLVPWNQGIDGGGRADGYMTREASAANGDANAAALPGDGVFAANDVHPLVQLNFSNREGQSFQTRGIQGAGSFRLNVPVKHYARMMLFLTSAEGPSRLHFKLAYADGAVEEREILLPDYYYDAPAGDTNVFSLGKNLPKWDAAGKMKERDHHYLHGVDVHPAAGKELVSVEVVKGPTAYLVFWGATGVTAD